MPTFFEYTIIDTTNINFTLLLSILPFVLQSSRELKEVIQKCKSLEEEKIDLQTDIEKKAGIHTHCHRLAYGLFIIILMAITSKLALHISCM